jgi:hypothetical protein
VGADKSKGRSWSRHQDSCHPAGPVNAGGPEFRQLDRDRLGDSVRARWEKQHPVAIVHCVSNGFCIVSGAVSGCPKLPHITHVGVFRMI